MIGYARVSTKDQSTKQQVQALLDHGVARDNIFIETISGVAHRRPRLEEAIAKLDKGDVFVVWKFDRFGRSLLDLVKRMEYFEKHGIGFVSLTEQLDINSSAGRFMVSILGAAAQFERDMIRERTRAGIQHKIKTEGYRPGPLPKLDADPKKIGGKLFTPRQWAQKLRDDGKPIPEIKQLLLDEFGISISHKTLYLQTVSDAKKPNRAKR